VPAIVEQSTKTASVFFGNSASFFGYSFVSAHCERFFQEKSLDISDQKLLPPEILAELLKMP